MSTNSEQAVDHGQLLIEKVSQPVFFQKLAQDHGIVPQTVEEAQALLDIGGQLLQKFSQDQAKAASARTSQILRARQGLQEFNQPSSTMADDAAVKMASALLKNDPALIQSAVAVQRANIAASTAAA